MLGLKSIHFSKREPGEANMNPGTGIVVTSTCLTLTNYLCLKQSKPFLNWTLGNKLQRQLKKDNLSLNKKQKLGTSLTNSLKLSQNQNYFEYRILKSGPDMRINGIFRQQQEPDKKLTIVSLLIILLCISWCGYWKQTSDINVICITVYQWQIWIANVLSKLGYDSSATVM